MTDAGYSNQSSEPSRYSRKEESRGIAFFAYVVLAVGTIVAIVLCFLFG